MVREEKFCRLLSRYEHRCQVFRLPAPELVPLIEAGKVDTPEMEQALHRLLEPYMGKLDALVLGCTHYPFSSHTIGKILGPQVEILDGGDGTARETRRRLEEAGLLSEGPGEVIIENSCPSPQILELSWRLLGQPREREK